MKKHVLIASSLVLLAAWFTTSVSAAEATSVRDLIPFSSRPFVERGMARETALRMLGEPGARLSRDAWIYFDFHAANPRFRRIKTIPAELEKLDTLVIEFDHNRVSRIRWCEGRPLREFLARRESRKPISPALAPD